MSRPPRRVLLVAHDRFPDGTDAECRIRSTLADAEVLIVAPALATRLQYWASDVGPGRAEAAANLASWLTGLTGHVRRLRAEVGDPSPLLAVGDALHDFPAREVVIVMRPPDREHWTERGLVARIVHWYSVEVSALVPAIRDQAPPRASERSLTCRSAALKGRLAPS